MGALTLTLSLPKTEHPTVAIFPLLHSRHPSVLNCHLQLQVNRHNLDPNLEIGIIFFPRSPNRGAAFARARIHNGADGLGDALAIVYPPTNMD